MHAPKTPLVAHRPLIRPKTLVLPGLVTWWTLGAPSTLGQRSPNKIESRYPSLTARTRFHFLSRTPHFLGLLLPIVYG